MNDKIKLGPTVNADDGVERPERDPALTKQLEKALTMQLRTERRLIEKRMKRKDWDIFPYRALQEHNPGGAAYIPSYMTYSRTDMALLLAAARMNGGLLPVKLRLAMLEPRPVPPEKKFSPILADKDDDRTSRNMLKRMRKSHRPR